MLATPTKTAVEDWDVSTIPTRWGIETIAFSNTDDRHVYVGGYTHAEAVASFRKALAVMPEIPHGTYVNRAGEIRTAGRGLTKS